MLCVVEEREVKRRKISERIMFATSKILT